MKHLTYADKSLLMGDEAADILIEYAAALARRGDADSVYVNAVGEDGDEVVATLLLDAGAPIMAETSHTSLPEPDNSQIIGYIRERLGRFRSPPAALPADEPDSADVNSHGDYELG